MNGGLLWIASVVWVGLVQGNESVPLHVAIILVDPGHGGQGYSKSYIGGTRGVDSRVMESELNLRVAEQLAKFLEQKGAIVCLTRTGDHRPTLASVEGR